jgi:putative protein-disulfide isomerase
MQSRPEIIYVGDPMCSWCWGIAPVIARLADRDDVDVRVIVGGLRPGPSAEPLDDRMRSMLASHWDKVAAMTGQPFNPIGLKRQEWTYDTELPAIAVATMRSLAPEKTLRFFNRLQQAFYGDGVDITDPDVYSDLIAGFDVDQRVFLAELSSDTARARAWDDFAAARELGVLGFPTVLLQVEGSTQVLSRGYAPLDHFENQLTYWVEGKQPDSASAYTCSVDGSIC